jgi:hypothetical protein
MDGKNESGVIEREERTKLSRLEGAATWIIMTQNQLMEKDYFILKFVLHVRQKISHFSIQKNIKQ